MRSDVTLLSAMLLAVLLLASQAALATITFTQIDDDVFSVSHRVKLIGSRGKAMRLVYTKAASLCIAAGYTHYRVLQQESEAAQEDDTANASVQVKFFQEDADDRIGCERGSDPAYIDEAGEKLRRRGYTPPPPPSASEPAASPTGASEEGTSAGSCTLEQIAAMARAGLDDDKIRAACHAGS
jgi:hypothetical protein